MGPGNLPDEYVGKLEKIYEFGVILMRCFRSFLKYWGKHFDSIVHQSYDYSTYLKVLMIWVGGLEHFFVFPNSWDDDPI